MSSIDAVRESKSLRDAAKTSYDQAQDDLAHTVADAVASGVSQNRIARECGLRPSEVTRLLNREKEISG